MSPADKGDTSSGYPYWGGWTEKGGLLHMAASNAGQFARSACGVVLTGGAYDITKAPADMEFATCRKCAYIDYRRTNNGGPAS